MYTLTEAATHLGIKRGTLLTQVRRGLIQAQLVGSVYLITASEVARYDEQRKQARGFARPDHPMHGKQGPGHRRKAEDRLPDAPTPRSGHDGTE